ncbi:MAG: zinc ribbon domain-containing protein [Clostridium sp.]|nr:zinc ribbon domain-containing protein [Clostridium sp.]
MNCPNCGAELPEGSTWCAACGNAVDAQQSGGGVNDALFSGAPTGVTAAPAKKSKVGAIIAVVAVIAVIAVLAVVVVLKGGKYNGTYELSAVSAFGFTYSAEEFEALSGQKLDMTLTVKGSKCILSADMADMGVEGSGSAKITFSGNSVTIEDGSQEITGTYDSSEKTITLSASGVDMVFKKR